MTDRTLPERMRDARDTLVDVAAREHGVPATVHSTMDYEYTAYRLNDLADQWEREDAEAAAKQAELDAEVEELARDLQHQDWPALPWDEFAVMHGKFRNRARGLHAAGWRKQQT